MAETILVTGGGGFLGQALIRRLLHMGHRIHTINRSRYPELEALGVHCFQGDIAERESLRIAAETCTVVFHVAAKAGIWGSYRDYYRSNVIGTENVIRICRELDIKRLIYTSSPSVSFAGKDQEGVDESHPLPETYIAHYPHTKAIAEKLVLAAADANLACVALRPHLIWGEGDQHLIPRILERAKTKRLRLVGRGLKKVDAVYIDNAVDAHICAFERLAPQSLVSGKAYFISNNEAMPMAQIINAILKAAGQPAVEKSISLRLAYIIGAFLELSYRLLNIKNEPPITRFAALQLGTAHWYNTKAASTELAYQPRVSMQEGFARLAESFARR